MAGASAWRTLWRINFPLLLPALLASGILSFVVAMESFEIPQLLGTPANIFVFTTRIYDLAYGGHVANFGAAMVLALILLALTGSLIVVQWRLLRGRVLHDCVRPRLQGPARSISASGDGSPSPPSSPSSSFSARCRSSCCS